MILIAAPGSCHGDSGGPVFQPARQHDSNIYVVLGVTSAGTSNIGHCGGINNPTHYTRLQKILPWILQYVSIDEICLADVNAVPAPL